MKKDVQTKREREKAMVSEMIALYCRNKHGRKGGTGLCPECAALDAYARQRSDKCPFMETKTFCSNCKVHCYRPEMREKIRAVMRFSGPRMIFRHPVTALRHVVEMKKETAFPFLLLAACCFAKSSERLHKWFTNTRLYKNNLESYVQGRGMTRKTKIRIMVTVTLLMSVGFLMMDQVPAGRIVLGCVWVFHILYFCFRVKTIKPDCPEA